MISLKEASSSRIPHKTVDNAVRGRLVLREDSSWELESEKPYVEIEGLLREASRLRLEGSGIKLGVLT
jgi:hypothetical protein